MASQTTPLSNEGNGHGPMPPSSQRQPQQSISSDPDDGSESMLFDEGAKLLSDLKDLETRASSYNTLAAQVFAEEAACLKELKEKRRAVKSYLARVRKSGGGSAQSSSSSSSSAAASASAPTIKNEGTKSTLTLLGLKRVSGLPDVVDAVRRRLAHVEYQLPRPDNIFLQFALGAKAPTTLRPKAHRLNYKREVETFKLTMTTILFVYALFCLLILDPVGWPKSTSACDAILVFFLIYYYSTVTLREHILVVNGSRIRLWWFMHHYLSIICSGVLLLWAPSSPSFQSFRTQFLCFCAYIAAVQYQQYRYQRKRLYVLVSLDLAAPMDTVAGEGALTDWSERELLVLVPFLFLAQMWQMWNAWTLWTLWDQLPVGHKEWQILATAALFLCIGLGNFVTTVYTFASKRPRQTSSSSPLHSPITSPHSSMSSLNVGSSAPMKRSLSGTNVAVPGAPLLVGRRSSSGSSLATSDVTRRPGLVLH